MMTLTRFKLPDGPRFNKTVLKKRLIVHCETKNTPLILDIGNFNLSLVLKHASAYMIVSNGSVMFKITGLKFVKAL